MLAATSTPTITTAAAKPPPNGAKDLTDGGQKVLGHSTALERNAHEREERDGK